VSAHERPRGIPQTGGEVGQRFEQSRMRPVTFAAVTPACDERWSSLKARRPLKRRWLPLRASLPPPAQVDYMRYGNDRKVDLLPTERMVGRA
jgi:hypothetical protein